MTAAASTTGDGRVLSAMLWRRDAGCALEYCRLPAHVGGFSSAGTALCAAPARVDDQVYCGGDRTMCVARVVLDRAGALRTLELEPRAGWRIDGAGLLGFADCPGFDIAVRRIVLSIGGAAACRAWWLRQPAFTTEPLAQCYTRSAELDYADERADGASRADACGPVRDYAGPWRGTPA